MFSSCREIDRFGEGLGLTGRRWTFPPGQGVSARTQRMLAGEVFVEVPLVPFTSNMNEYRHAAVAVVELSVELHWFTKASAMLPMLSLPPAPLIRLVCRFCNAG